MTMPKAEDLHLFFDDPSADVLISTILSLTAELSVARERIDTLERLLADRGVIDRSEIETFEPAGAAASERAAMRQAILKNVVAKMEAYFEQASRAEK